MTVQKTAEHAILQDALGYTFRDPTLLERALTHRSYTHEHPEELAETNERLEFLGDAIFQFFVSDTLFRRLPDQPEGRLTALRAAVVSTTSFAAIGETLRLADHVRVSRGEAALDGRGRQSILAGCVEAIVAAVYFDTGDLTETRALVDRLVEPRIEAALSGATPENVKGRLQELLQAQRGVTPVYRVLDHDGPDHARRFEVEVLAGSVPLGRGTGIGKREAETHAARAALAELERT
jgi:ribonuclease-3